MATPSEKPEFVLFLTPNCKFCNNFINKLKSKPELAAKFNIVDIDKLPDIPAEVDEVPCVYDGKVVHKGQGAFKWLNEKLVEFLSPANDGLMYSFVDGQEESVFNNYSLIDQRNGSYGMGGDAAAHKPDSRSADQRGDPTRMAIQNDSTNKNRTMDSLMASRSELK